MSSNEWYPPPGPVYEPDPPPWARERAVEEEPVPSDAEIAEWDSALPSPPLLAHDDD